jgi:hypothetical protein
MQRLESDGNRLDDPASSESTKYEFAHMQKVDSYYPGAMSGFLISWCCLNRSFAQPFWIFLSIPIGL